MIQFFRRIRQKLVAEGRMSKYLLYAIGEIALVMIGILLALQVNNWNEEKKINNDLSLYYESLKQNLKKDIILFKGIKESAKFRYYASQYLVELAGSISYNAERDGIKVFEWNENYIWNHPIPNQYDSVFIEKAFLWTHRIRMPNSNLDETVEELKSTGNYSKLNKSIKEEINAYYDDWEFGFSDVSKEIISDIRLEWQSSLREDGIHNSDPYMFGEPMNLIIDNTKRLAILRKLAMEAAWNAERADLLVTNAEKFIELIEEESPE